MKGEDWILLEWKMSKTAATKLSFGDRMRTYGANDSFSENITNLDPGTTYELILQPSILLPNIFGDRTYLTTTMKPRPAFVTFKEFGTNKISGTMVLDSNCERVVLTVNPEQIKKSVFVCSELHPNGTSFTFDKLVPGTNYTITADVEAGDYVESNSFSVFTKPAKIEILEYEIQTNNDLDFKFYLEGNGSYLQGFISHDSNSSNRTRFSIPFDTYIRKTFDRQFYGKELELSIVSAEGENGDTLILVLGSSVLTEVIFFELEFNSSIFLQYETKGNILSYIEITTGSDEKNKQTCNATMNPCKFEAFTNKTSIDIKVVTYSEDMASPAVNFNYERMPYVNLVLSEENVEIVKNDSGEPEKLKFRLQMPDNFEKIQLNFEEDNSSNLFVKSNNKG